MKRGISPKGPGKVASVKSMGGASRLGPSGAAPQPRLPKVNTRDYGKPAPMDMATSPNPFGSAGNSRLGGI